MQTPITITKAPPAHPSLDFHLLRQEGIKHFQRLSGHLWTDHNTHDPGITIWEHLCYALTDLGYRMQMDLKDILAYKATDSFEDFFTTAEILSTAPVSLRDYRKLIIDVPGVRNAWIEPADNQTPLYFDPDENTIITQRNPPEATSRLEKIEIKGLYRVLLAGEGTGVESEVARRLHANRSLGMDFTAIQLMPKESISLEMDIEIEEVEDGVELLGEILYKLDAYVSPQISFYTMFELLEEGKTYEEIFDGPRLEHGFIKDEELDRFQRKTALYASDIIQEVMDVEGVGVVRGLTMVAGTKREKWVLNLAENYTPEFQAMISSIRFFRGGLEIKVDQSKAIEYATQKKQAFSNRAAVDGGYDRKVQGGRARQLQAYESVQHHFPENYGIGERGLSANASPERRGQAKQLKAYLVFFEQILVNLLSQNAHSARLFSFHSEQNRSYYAQSLRGSIRELGTVLNDPSSYRNRLESITESPLDGLKRKKRFLNHILARFGEQFTEYSLVLFGAISDANGQPSELDIASIEVNTRKTFLQEYPEISSKRHLGFNYTSQSSSWDTEEVSGLKRRIARLLGLRNVNRTNITYLSDGFTIEPEEQGDGSIIYSWVFEHEDMRMRSHRDYANEEMAQIALQQFIQLAADPANYRITPSGRGLRLEDDAGIIARRDNLRDQAASESLRDDLVSFFSETYPQGSPENFHMLEHILLRPILGQVIPVATQQLLDKVPRKDPYSLQVSFILPNWNRRFRDPEFRAYTEQLIRREAPAYLSIFIHWMDWGQMANFENGYRQWLEVLAEG